MAEYHGDLMHRAGTIYKADDDRNYPVAMLLALLFGAMGVHRFFLNDRKIGMIYFFSFAVACLISMALLNFTVLSIYLLVASPFVLGEIIYFAYMWVKR